MPVALRFPSNPLPRLKTFAESLLTTKAQRFRLAVSSGFVIVAAGALVLGAGSFGIADTIWGIMEIPGLSSPPMAASAEREPSAQYRASRHHHAHRYSEDAPQRTAERHKSRHKHLAALADKSDGSEAAGAPVQLARTSMCVRLCDGFVFPIGNYYGEGDRAAHEATCQSECPGAKTALYVRPAGSDTVADATQVSTGKNYSQMSDAFHYTTYVDETCSCHPPGGSRVKSLLRDFTLRRGDTVMTSKGLQVFHGGSSYPFRRRDFVALSQSRDIQQAARTSLKAIERASLISSTTIASRPVAPSAKTAAVKAAPAVTSDASHSATKGLQHQARN